MLCSQHIAIDLQCHFDISEEAKRWIVQKLNCMYSGFFLPLYLPGTTLLHDPEVLLLMLFFLLLLLFICFLSFSPLFCTLTSYCVVNLTWLFSKHHKNCCCDFDHFNALICNMLRLIVLYIFIIFLYHLLFNFVCYQENDGSGSLYVPVPLLFSSVCLLVI